jgi:anti-sigma B factor antagonist
MNKQGSMVIRGASEEVMEIFDVTGFVDILTIES